MRAFCLFGILFMLLLAAGCAQTREGYRPLANTTIPEYSTSKLPGGNDPCAAGTLPQNGSALLLAEAERELALLNVSGYSHTTLVNETNGSCEYDCSGFVGYALSRADPCACAMLLHDRPDTGNFYDYFTGLGTVPGAGGWMRILFPRDLHPGDIIVWPRNTSEPESSGHIMIVAGSPKENSDRRGELLVRVIDSTTSRHADDTRAPGATGLGEGTIGIMTDNSGNATGYFWRGGESKVLQETGMAFARIA